MFYGYGCSTPLLLVLLFIGVVGFGGPRFGTGFGRGGYGCVSSCGRGKYGVRKRGCYSYSSGSCGGSGYGFGNRNSRLILYIILLFLFGGFSGFGRFGFGGFC